MIKGLKFMLAGSIVLIGAGAGFAAARTVTHGNRDAVMQTFDASNERFKQLDRNRDGVLSAAEFATLNLHRGGTHQRP